MTKKEILNELKGKVTKEGEVFLKMPEVCQPALEKAGEDFKSILSEGLIIVFKYREGRMQKHRCHCSKCGSSWTQDEPKEIKWDNPYEEVEWNNGIKWRDRTDIFIRESNDVFTCPSCGKEAYGICCDDNSSIGSAEYCFIREFDADEGYAIITSMDIRVHLPEPKNNQDKYGNIDYSSTDFILEPGKTFDSIFSVHFGLLPNERFYPGQNRLLTVYSSTYRRCCENFCSDVYRRFVDNKNSEAFDRYLSTNWSYEKTGDLRKDIALVNLYIRRKKREKATTTFTEPIADMSFQNR